MSRVYTQEELDHAFSQVCQTRRSIPREQFTKEVVAEIQAALQGSATPSDSPVPQRTLLSLSSQM